jgi:alkyl sulfatase BDS1-like metallo-beta-lactamase superfamily hydrolase
MSVRLIGEKADGKSLSVKITFTDLQESYLLTVHNSVLHHKKVDSDVTADATLNLTQELFVKIIIAEAGLKETLFGEELSVEGSKLDLVSFFSMLDKPTGAFNIVTP